MICFRGVPSSKVIVSGLKTPSINNLSLKSCLLFRNEIESPPLLSLSHLEEWGGDFVPTCLERPCGQQAGH